MLFNPFFRVRHLLVDSPSAAIYEEIAVVVGGILSRAASHRV